MFFGHVAHFAVLLVYSFTSRAKRGFAFYMRTRHDCISVFSRVTRFLGEVKLLDSVSWSWF